MKLDMSEEELEKKLKRLAKIEEYSRITSRRYQQRKKQEGLKPVQLWITPQAHHVLTELSRQKEKTFGDIVSELLEQAQEKDMTCDSQQYSIETNPTPLELTELYQQDHHDEEQPKLTQKIHKEITRLGKWRIMSQK
ncbi:MAG: hypothetical protein HQK77_19435, partial [Desulfobacterales bacterium]|nr:hypothetical protein [Desulfobacterales bacterium]